MQPIPKDLHRLFWVGGSARENVYGDESVLGIGVQGNVRFREKDHTGNSSAFERMHGRSAERSQPTGGRRIREAFRKKSTVAQPLRRDSIKVDEKVGSDH
jgi:hypothetical protein